MSQYPKYGSREWKIFQYLQALKARRGHNYAYYSSALDEELEAKGYQWHKFKDGDHSTYSELEAKEVVETLRSNSNYARIICGVDKNHARMKTFSVTFKKKSNEKT